MSVPMEPISLRGWCNHVLGGYASSTAFLIASCEAISIPPARRRNSEMVVSTLFPVFASVDSQSR